MSIMQNSCKLIAVGIVSWSLLNGCFVEEVPISKPILTTTTDSSTTSQVVPPINTQTSSSILPDKRYLCITSFLPKSWPVDAAIAEWNKNKVNEFRYDSPDTLCKPAGAIVLIEERMICCMGEASFLNGKVTIRFNPDVPRFQRQHVVCHELGHVLGLVHSNNKSCMNISAYIPLPSSGDLVTVAAQEWQWSRIVKAVHGDGR